MATMRAHTNISRRDETSVQSLFKMDPWMLLATIVLVIAGLMAVNSAAIGQGKPDLFKKQLILTAVGLIPFAIFWKVRIASWRSAASVLWVVNNLMLLGVLFAGHKVKGSQRWIEIGFFQFQPSEMSKILLIVTLSAFYAARKDKIHELKTVLLSLAHVAPTLFLIFRQPHLGATAVCALSWLVITIIAGVPWRNLVITLVALIALVGVGVAAGKIGLHLYQLERVTAMKQDDELGADYQVTRAEIAYGVGGVFGTGYLKGDVKSKVPEQHNDFIFSVVGEEGGLIVCTLILIAYTFLYLRIWMVMIRSTDLFGRLAAAGVFTVLGFHTIINLGMNLQLAPVVGLWLPFMSYGGTAMWLCLGCVGLAQNVYRSSGETVFS